MSQGRSGSSAVRLATQAPDAEHQQHERADAAHRSADCSQHTGEERALDVERCHKWLNLFDGRQSRVCTMVRSQEEL